MKAPLTIRTLKPKGPDSPHTYVTDQEESDRLTQIARAVVFDPAVYSRAADLIETGGFSQGWLALNSRSKTVDLTSPDAVCFCIMGAITRAGFDLGYIPDQKDAETLWNSLGNPARLALGLSEGVPRWNNTRGRTAQEAIQALRGASIERIEEEYTRE